VLLLCGGSAAPQFCINEERLIYHSHDNTSYKPGDVDLSSYEQALSFSSGVELLKTRGHTTGTENGENRQ
jgi:hypothetical protein